MTKRALAALLACLALAPLAAACGGGDSTNGGVTSDSTSGGGQTGASGGETSGDSGSAPTKAVFIKEADAICEKADLELRAEIEAYADKHGISEDEEPSEAQQATIYAEVVLPNIKRQGAAIAVLTPPDGEEKPVGEIVEAIETGVESGEANPTLLVEGINTLEDASEKAVDYGMKVCGADIH